MPLHGKGMLIVFCEVKARDERDLNEWYNREHIDERVNLPGFHRGRRYVAVRGSPKYLATYESDTVEDLATPGYLALLANQTEYVSPGLMHWTLSGELMVMVLLGGLGTLYGPVLGAAVFLLLEETLAMYTEHWMLYLGPFLVVSVIFCKNGLLGLLAGRKGRDD